MPARPVKIPQRTCVACGAKKAQGEFLRVVSQAGAAPHIDNKGRAPGRGAYLCRESACVEKAFAQRALERALKLQNPAPPALKSEILAAIKVDQKAEQKAD